jgi:hypothetical protein
MYLEFLFFPEARDTPLRQGLEFHLWLYFELDNPTRGFHKAFASLAVRKLCPLLPSGRWQMAQ